MLFCSIKPLERSQTVSYRCRYKINSTRFYWTTIIAADLTKSYQTFNRYTQNDLILALLKLTGPQTDHTSCQKCHSHQCNLIATLVTQVTCSDTAVHSTGNREYRTSMHLSSTLITRTPGLDLCNGCKGVVSLPHPSYSAFPFFYLLPCPLPQSGVVDCSLKEVRPRYDL